MYPLTFIPILKSMIWGGDKLLQYKGMKSATVLCRLHLF